MTSYIIWISVRQTAVPRRGLWARAHVDTHARAMLKHSLRSVSDLVFTCAVAEEEDAALEAQAKKDEEEVEVDERVMRGKDLDRRTDLAVTDRRCGRPSGWDSSGACLCRLAVYPLLGYCESKTVNKSALARQADSPVSAGCSSFARPLYILVNIWNVPAAVRGSSEVLLVVADKCEVPNCVAA